MIAHEKPVYPAGGGATGMTTMQAVLNLQAGRLVTEGWGFLYERYRPMVIRVVCNRCHDLDRAMDVAEAVFERLPERIHEYDPATARFSTWLCRCAKNELIDEWRSNDAQHRREAEYACHHPLPDSRPTRAYEQLVARETYRRLWEQLPEHERVVVQMYRIDGYPLKELCAMFGITPRLAYFYLSDAASRMRRAYEQELKQRRIERLKRKKKARDQGES